MARAVWSGAISFGLVNVPVKAYTAVHEHTVHFNQLDKNSLSRIRYEKVAEKTGKQVRTDDIGLGYEVDRGKYVVVDPDEIEALRPRTTKTIDVGDFVDMASIDPTYYARSYWLAPDGEASTNAYRLLAVAMNDEGKVGIGRVVMRNKQYLAAIRPVGGALVMSTMHFYDEMVPASDIDGIPSGKEKSPTKERHLAAQLIQSLVTEWDPKQYHDTYNEELRELIAKRARGEEVVVEEEPPAQKANVVDLMAALEASIEAAKKGRKGDVERQLEKAAESIGDEPVGEQPAATKVGARKSDVRASAARKSAVKKVPASKSPTARRGTGPRRKSA